MEQKDMKDFNKERVPTESKDYLIRPRLYSLVN